MVIHMPPDFVLSKEQLWVTRLIGAVFGSLRDDSYLDFLKAGELDRIVNQPGGSFGGKVPDGGPGSKLPNAGGKNPLDVLGALFGGLAAGLGEVDRAYGVDPSADGKDEVQVIPLHENGTLGAIIQYADGRSEMWAIDADGVYQSIVRDGDTLTNTRIYSYGPGECIVDRWTSVGAAFPGVHEVWKYGPDGARSPGDGGDTNTERNPLSRLEALGPLSMEQIFNQMMHPGSYSDELDPNISKDGFRFNDEDQERLARTAPALDTLDPNSGIDPLTSLNIDSGRIRTSNDKDDRLDPNTGQKPVPGGG